VSLYNKTLEGLKWNFLGTIITICIQIGAGIVLARLLMPSDFGLYAMTFAVLAISRSVIDSGLYQALIQKKDADEVDFSLVFHFNFLLSIIIFFLLFFSSNKIQEFYGYDEISKIIKFLSLIVLIESFSLIQRASLIKEIKFDKITKIETLSKLISLTICIIMAYKGYGVWSLLFKDLFFSLLTTVLYWCINPVKILLIVPYKRIKSLFNFGFKVFIADQIESITNQFVQIIVGKRFTASDLGFFNKAEEFQLLFSQTIIVSINKVMFPSLVQIQNDNQKLKLKYKMLLEISLLLLFPILFVAILVGNEMIIVLIGDKWIGSVFYFQLLCLSGMFYPFSVFNLNLLKVKGKAGLYLKTCIVSKGLLIPIIFIGIQYGIVGIVIGLVIQRFLAVIINSYYSGKIIDFSTYQQIKSVGKSFFISVFLFLFLYHVKINFAKDLSNIHNLIVFPFTYILFYVIISTKYQSRKMDIVMGLIKSFSGSKNK
jgi:teichuronic acid exporter